MDMWETCIKELHEKWLPVHWRNVCLGNDEPSEYSGAKQARKILEQAAALFASGTMNNEDKTTFMDEMTRLYLASKKNRRKW